jgi:hypothetical protein
LNEAVERWNCWDDASVDEYVQPLVGTIGRIMALHPPIGNQYDTNYSFPTDFFTLAIEQRAAGEKNRFLAIIPLAAYTFRSPAWGTKLTISSPGYAPSLNK